MSNTFPVSVGNRVATLVIKVTGRQSTTLIETDRIREPHEVVVNHLQSQTVISLLKPIGVRVVTTP